MKKDQIIIALDFPTGTEAFHFLDKLNQKDIWVKVGMELFYQEGPSLVEKLAKNHSVFLDLKLHDIPKTVHQGLKSLSSLPIKMINVHAQGGREMLSSAKEAMSYFSTSPFLIAVTTLTSLDQTNFKQDFQYSFSVQDYVLRLAQLTYDCGLDGVVCSPLEISVLKNQFGHQFKTVTPGIRFDKNETHDQKRTLSPTEAFALGGDWLVIGRALTKAQKPQEVWDKILKGEL